MRGIVQDACLDTSVSLLLTSSTMSKRASEAAFSKDLDKKKQVLVKQFNGINLVDIREFYTDKATGEKKPGKKGIALSEDAWRALIDSRDEVTAALQELGGKRPHSEVKKVVDGQEKAAGTQEAGHETTENGQETGQENGLE